MRRVFLISLLLVSLFVSIGLTAESSPQAIVLAHVAAVDVAAGRTLTDVSVTIVGDRITDVSRSGSWHAPADARVIDATGKFLIPGLWDMHVHWYEKAYLPLFLANGVTGVRQMIGTATHREWRRETESGSLIAPRMLIPANLDGPGSPSSWVSVRDDVEARQAVQTAKRDAADFIKVYDHVPRDAFFAIADESRKLGISFAGHVPDSVSPEEASDAGITSIEHLTGFLNAVAPGLDELRRLQQEIAQSRAPVPWDRARQAWKAARDSYSVAREEALLTRFKRNHTWQTPTLTEERGAYIYDAAWLDDPRLRYLPPTIAADWKQRAERMKARPQGQADFQAWMYEREVEAVGRMNRMGVDLLAGTDARLTYCLPGFGVHDELALLVGAGLTPAEALRTATVNPARFLNREKDLGTIEKGKIADLVLLDANPLQDIRNTTRIRAVVVNGRLLDRKTLTSMLNEIEALSSTADRK